MHLARRPRRRRLLVLLGTDPVRLRPARDRRSPRPPRSPAASTSRRMVMTAMLHLRRARRPRRPAAAVRRGLHATARLPGRPRLHRHRASRCSAATTRSASPSARCCGPSWTSSPTACRSRPTCHRDRRDHPGRDRAARRHRLRARPPLRTCASSSARVAGSWLAQTRPQPPRGRSAGMSAADCPSAPPSPRRRPPQERRRLSRGPACARLRGRRPALVSVRARGHRR